ncbi:hypothetical protein CH063_05979 [Colletotrichum higginsianum]|uniref:Uncharacterized protein n=1 Tax=Colletotrichum higginsianum (strain IMI 349063) TaxID=759273 RepID=H1V0X9_COLHI|nr:hypothetical protein CH63R_14131 [Colletotrichum higginsianum IMI 349063]OBR02905.1 hypothetical protein CH63R_14131 [Colletotrichum higginsianum IMI 349063]CCF33880.1 hypothetical protein CH063_05979 [Colletotrichum higginsianum]
MTPVGRKTTAASASFAVRRRPTDRTTCRVRRSRHLIHTMAKFAVKNTYPPTCPEAARGQTMATSVLIGSVQGSGSIGWRFEPSTTFCQPSAYSWTGIDVEIALRWLLM